MADADFLGKKGNAVKLLGIGKVWFLCALFLVARPLQAENMKPAYDRQTAPILVLYMRMAFPVWC